MNVTLVVNPKASAYTDKRRADAARILGEGHELEVVETRKRGHATDLAGEAAAGGANVVAVLGGDGTLNEAANALVGTQTALAPLPGGSTNVFARTVGIHRKLAKALPQVHGLLGSEPHRIGLGNVNGRYFLFHVGIGYDAAVVAKVEQKPHLKRKIGQLIFVYASLATWSRGFDRKAPHFVVKTGLGDPNGVVVEDGYFGICLNSNPYTYLGIRPLNAALGDAWFDRPLVLVTLRSLKLFTFLPLIGSTLGKGKKLRKHAKVDYRSGIDAITVTAAPGRDGIMYQADGDYLGLAPQLEFSFEPSRLLLVAP